jgi:AcrR family transcriptional regulator
MVTTPGLRERKKLQAMRHIQEVALDLFDRRGFEAVTIEEIAEAAQVSPSSVYRYFGTKENVILWDEVDVRWFDAIENELASRPPIDAMRQALAGAMADLLDRDEELSKRKTRYALGEPALRPALLQLAEDFTQQVTGAVARASGRSPDDLEPRVIAAAMIAAMMAAARHWHDHDYRTQIREDLEEALAVLERGI